MREWDVIRLAVQFLTRVPVGRPAWSEAAQAATIRWFACVGLLIGGVGAGVLWLASLVLPPLVSAAASTGAVLLLTGAFHEDGLADAADGLGGGSTRQRTLEIMRDSRIGTYGAVALVLVLLTKVLTLGSMTAGAAAVALVAGHTMSRASVVLAVETSRYLRDHGTGKPVAQGAGGLGVTLNLACAAAGLVVLGAVAGWDAALVGSAGATVGHLGMRCLYERRLGGYTGDCLGAVQQCSELGVLLGVLACL
ncbi:adenosylcobinamide-GDP ribazoletransferase [Phycicoccus avicenniae]|uniref:adenosylcobinamide-GDP ribazoletransferase n=1 Tax=Phycicoccus avicenniae TaxID=2828860 RepID=UPI003D27CAB3